MQTTSTSTPLNNSGFRILAGVLILTGLYSILRYQIFGGVPWHMFPTYVFNKIVCFAGFICLALNYTLGPLRNIGVNVSQGWLNARQTLGISGFFLILFHLFLSLILLKPEIFGKFFDADGGYTTQAGISMVAGIAAFLFLWLYNASFHTFLKEDEAFMRFMNSRKTLLTSFLFTAFHLFMMGYEGWMRPQDWHGGLPPITLVCFVIFAAGYFINLAGRK